MAKRGPKAATEEELLQRSTDAPHRQVHDLYPDHDSQPDPDDIPPLPGMTAASKRIWKQKVERYRKRGQKISGFEEALRQYCELEAMLNKAFKNGTVTMAMVNAHRIWCSEFFDTPASQRVRSTGGNNTPANRFGRNGKKPS